jgi:hypothetical protein
MHIKINAFSGGHFEAPRFQAHAFTEAGTSPRGAELGQFVEIRKRIGRRRSSGRIVAWSMAEPV